MRKWRIQALDVVPLRAALAENDLIAKRVIARFAVSALEKLCLVLCQQHGCPLPRIRTL